MPALVGFQKRFEAAFVLVHIVILAKKQDQLLHICLAVGNAVDGQEVEKRLLELRFQEPVESKNGLIGELEARSAKLIIRTNQPDAAVEDRNIAFVNTIWLS